MKLSISTRTKKILAVVLFIALFYVAIFLFTSLSFRSERILPWIASFFFSIAWVVVLGFIWPNIISEDEPAQKSIKAQKILVLIGIAGALSSVTLIIAFLILINQTMHLHHYNADIGWLFKEYPSQMSKIANMLSFGILAGSVGFLAVLIGKKNIYKWLGLASLLIVVLCCVLFYYEPATDLIFPDNFVYSVNELIRFNFSVSLYQLKKYDMGIEIPASDDWLGGVLKQMPIYSEKFKPDLAYKEQKELIDEVFEWWKVNKNYLIWRDDKFIIDEEAMSAGVWSDEYRTTHPWPEGDAK